ncbi:MAG: DNA repair protein RecO [Porticoccaceae bacterium]
MRTESEHIAYVLHKRPFRETSVLVDLFCRDQGRIRAVARGARGKHGAKRLYLEPFTPLLVTWRGNSGLKTLVRAESAAQAKPSLLGHTLYLGFYVNELLMRLLAEDDAHEYLYQHYSELLLRLSSSNISTSNSATADLVDTDVSNADLSNTSNLEPLLRVFELSLLEEIGYALPLDTDSLSGAPVASDTWYRLIPGDGLVSVPAHDAASRHELFSGAHLLAMAATSYQDNEVRKCAKRLLRLALANQLGNKPLRSREFFESYSKNLIETTGSTGLKTATPSMGSNESQS